MVLPLLWVLLAALALVLGWTSGAPALLWVGALMLAVWLAAVAAGRLAARSLIAVRTISADRIPHGGEVEVTVTVANAGPLPALWLSAAESLPAGLAMTGLRGRVGPLSGRGSFRFRYTLHGSRRGWYQLGPTVLRVGDLFGLSQREVLGGGVSPITVYPRVLPITHARLPSRRLLAEVRARQRALEDPTQVVGIRPYQRGDSLRRVHWRATAHTGRLQSKLFEISAQVDTMIVVNLNRRDYPDSPADAEETAEIAVTTAASIAHHVLERRQRVGLLVLGRDPAEPVTDAPIRVRPGRGREQLAGILSVLGRVQLGAGPDLYGVIEREKERWNWGSAVVAVTPRLGSQALMGLAGLRRAGFEACGLVVGRGSLPAADASGLEAVGVRATVVRSDGDIGGLAL